VASDGNPLVGSPETFRVVARYQLYGRLVWALYILAAAVPIHEMVPIANAISGRQTSLTVTLTAGLTFTAALGGGNVVQWWRGRRQGAELKRLRARVSSLEDELSTSKVKRRRS
jgi:hypothetical protein